MSLPDEDQEFTVEHSFLMFLITLDDLGLSPTLHTMLSIPASELILAFWNKIQDKTYPVKGVNLL